VTKFSQSFFSSLVTILLQSAIFQANREREIGQGLISVVDHVPLLIEAPDDSSPSSFQKLGDIESPFQMS
jgi:hypothetical protein